MKKLQELRNNEKGFTLIELIIVIAILAIIAAIAIPNIIGAVDDSRKSTDIANAKIIANAAAQVIAKNEDASGTTYDVDAALIISDALDGGSTFEDALFDELNGNPATPAYQGNTGVDEDNFYLVMLDTGAVQVWVGASDDTASDLQLYPDLDSTYE